MTAGPSIDSSSSACIATSDIRLSDHEKYSAPKPSVLLIWIMVRTLVRSHRAMSASHRRHAPASAPACGRSCRVNDQDDHAPAPPPIRRPRARSTGPEAPASASSIIARAWLEWSQADLSRAAGMALSSIKAIESCSSSPRRETLEAIAATFEAAGIDFCPPSGVRLKTDVVTVHQGRDAAAELMNSILRHAPNDPSQELCIIGLDEHLAAELDGPDVHPTLRARLAQAGVRERILISQGVKEFLREETSYRWMSRDGFCRNAPFSSTATRSPCSPARARPSSSTPSRWPSICAPCSACCGPAPIRPGTSRRSR